MAGLIKSRELIDAILRSESYTNPLTLQIEMETTRNLALLDIAYSLSLMEGHLQKIANPLIKVEESPKAEFNCPKCTEVIEINGYKRGMTITCIKCGCSFDDESDY